MGNKRTQGNVQYKVRTSKNICLLSGNKPMMEENVKEQMLIGEWTCQKN